MARLEHAAEVTPPTVEDPLARAQAWARAAIDARDWKSLAEVFDSQDYTPEFNKNARKRLAKAALLEAGAEAQDAIIEQLKTNGVGTNDLAAILEQIGDARAVGPLLDVFDKVAPYGGAQADIVRFLAKVNATDAAPRLVPFLDDDYSPTRVSAAYGLGLLAVESTRAALVAALKKNPSSITDGLQLARTDFARDLVAEAEGQRKAAGPDVAAMGDAEMTDALGRLCAAYTANDKPTIEQLEPLATDIGEELDRRGGIAEMRRVFALLHGREGARTLEMHWGGIGDWLG